MTSDGFAQTMNLVASQLEAASTLLKYAADDLRDMGEQPQARMLDELRLISQNLLTHAAAIDGNAAFCIRIGEDMIAGDGIDDRGQTAFDNEVVG